MFRIKKDAAGKIKHYKARLVAKGFTQVFGVDYYDTWAPVAKLGSIRLLLATAVQHGWPINMFNFHNAFLNGKLDSDEEVFMEQPQGFEELDKKRYVCKCQDFTGRTPARVQDGSLLKGLNEYPTQLPCLGQLRTRVGSKSLVMQDYRRLPWLITAPEYFRNLRRGMSQVATRTFNVLYCFPLI